MNEEASIIIIIIVVIMMITITTNKTAILTNDRVRFAGTGLSICEKRAVEATEGIVNNGLSKIRKHAVLRGVLG